MTPQQFDKQVIEAYTLGTQPLYMNVNYREGLIEIYDKEDRLGNLWLYNLDCYSPLEAIVDFLSKFNITLTIKIIQ